MFDYDLIVIGAGPGGYEAALKAATLGKKVLLIEKDNFGGTCTNVGCIPTKALLHCAKTYKHAVDAPYLTGDLSFSLSDAMKYKEETIQLLRNGIELMLRNAKVCTKFGVAAVKDAHTVTVGDESFTCEYLIIATGSRPAVIPIEGHNLPIVKDSTAILSSDKLPASIVIIGGGVIGVEFASFFNMLGVKTTIVEMMDEILPMMDNELAKLMRRELKEVKFYLGCGVSQIKENGVVFKDSKGQEVFVEAESVLMAAGRRTNAEGFESLGVEFERRCIKVDSTMKTSVEGVYAIGDVNGLSQLAHSASEMAEVAVNNIFGSKTLKFRSDAIPWAVYSNPEAAGCGLTEQAAEKAGIKVKTATAMMRSNGRFLAECGKRASGMVKVIASEDGTVLGIHLVGPFVSEMIWGASVAVSSKMKVSDIANSVFAHPSVSEVIREACRSI